jgi:hypothetical protein
LLKGLTNAFYDNFAEDAHIYKLIMAKTDGRSQPHPVLIVYYVEIPGAIAPLAL